MIILTHGYGQTDRPTNRPTDIATYRAAIAAKNIIGSIGIHRKFKSNGLCFVIGVHTAIEHMNNQEKYFLEENGAS